MKILIVAMIVLAAVGCSSTRPIQVEMVRAELIKIDTIYRQQDEQKIFTWRSQDNIEYITFMPMSQTYKIGASILVMRNR